MKTNNLEIGNIYADNTVIYFSKPDISQTLNSLQADFDATQKWLSSNKLLLNKKKSYRMLFTTRANSLHLNNWSINFLDGTPLEKLKEFKYLGIWLDFHLSFKTNIESVVKKMNCSLRILYRSVNCFTLQVRKRIASQLILPILDYADIVY